MGNYIYIAECADGTWYTGWTTDPERRIAVHNSGKGAKYTRSRLPVRLIYTEEYETAVEAQRREYAIKRLSRAQKESLLAAKKIGTAETAAKEKIETVVGKTAKAVTKEKIETAETATKKIETAERKTEKAVAKKIKTAETATGKNRTKPGREKGTEE